MKIIRSAEAIDDVLDNAFYIALDSYEAARRFLSSTEKTFRQLAEMPSMGRKSGFAASHLADLRQWRVKGFESYLIFYRPIEGGIEVVRVLHGARDIERLMSEEESKGDD